MATRAIVTDQPEVECEICGRRLLRGERPDRFLAQGVEHSVCELCAPRAVDAGWVRAAGESRQAQDDEAHRRRGNGLLALMRRRRDASADVGAAGEEPPGRRHGRARPVPAPTPLFDDALPGFADEVAQPESSASMHAELDELDELSRHGRRGDDPAIQAAIDAFNSTDQPQRIAGVARSLGTPWVTVRRGDADAGAEADAREGVSDRPTERLVVVAAWELCWYRWEIDLDGYGPVAELVDRGTELDELTPADLAANVAIDERGRLTAAPAADSVGS